jgi:hypothetical protein
VTAATCRLPVFFAGVPAAVAAAWVCCTAVPDMRMRLQCPSPPRLLAHHAAAQRSDLTTRWCVLLLLLLLLALWAPLTPGWLLLVLLLLADAHEDAACNEADPSDAAVPLLQIALGCQQMPPV